MEKANTTSRTNQSSNGLDVIQSMIDISADRLEGLRTQCATSATLTQQEIRTLETKLVRMFSELLATKARLPERIPSSGLPASNTEVTQWLRVVGLSTESLNICLQCENSLEKLLDKSDTELRDILDANPNLREEDVRRLTRAMKNLKRCRDAFRSGAKEPDNLYWDSWDRHHHLHHHHRSNVSVGNASTAASPRTYRAFAKQAPKARQSPVNGNQETLTQQYAGMSAGTPEEVLMSFSSSPSPPNSPAGAGINSNSSSSNTPTQKHGHRKSGTPPPKKKHQTLLSAQQQHPATPSHTSSAPATSVNANIVTPVLQDPITLTKSKSHESQLMQENAVAQILCSASVNSSTQQKSNSAYVGQHGSNQIIPRTRLHTEPGPDPPPQFYNTPDFITENSNNLTVPRSPCTPIVSVGMGHMIAHRFAKVFKVMSTCDLCQKQMFFGLKCKECKYRCHKDCEANVPPSCGLPREFVDEFRKTLQSNDVFLPNASPNLSGRASGYLTAGRRPKASKTASHAPDSSSPGSSCNSSSPSSPALFGINAAAHMHHSQHSNQSQITTPTPSSAQKQQIQFDFPDVIQQKNSISIQYMQPHYSYSNHLPNSSAAADSVAPLKSSASNSSNSSVSGGSVILPNQQQMGVYQSGNFKIRKPSYTLMTMQPPLSEMAETRRSHDSDKTVSLSGSTTASTDSDRRTPVRLDSTEDGDSGNWPRQNSLSLKEWDIPYTDLHLMETIGVGRFGTVRRALWHGDVAVKVLKENYLGDLQTLEAFKLEVATFKKTRHENLVLFMGACMNPPFLALVTSLCKGNTLYTYIHVRRDKFNLNRTTLVAQQISQGMGYLHARGIFHKDLRTKNIFLENGKVIITDFGLFSSTKLLYCDKLGLGIPGGWLCYLAPELMRALTPYCPADEILPFSRASDVFSFGTVWYELLCGEFPFKQQPPESVIWQVGRGMKQTLANLQTSRDVKDILMFCWAFQADDRPDFAKLLILLERLPKKRLARSPSHPVQLSRSAESVF